MQKDVHFKNTFAATPSLDASRMARAEGVGRAMVRLTWDISSAFQQAPHVGFGKDKGNLLAVKYPKGFERWCKKIRRGTSCDIANESKWQT